MRVVASGIVIGLVVTLAAGRVVEPLLFRTSPREPAVLAWVAAVLLLVAFLAIVLPTWRAVRSDKILALRNE